ncbi:MAG: hypothetical protein G01um101448_297 [Parcubacteria group bacterium Gr01-1014_48]|nr:MAG: hypothetical protein Greene041614_615 [Parcubacteria group bacterium Greene0416_14]TSC74187.1 MAG: hypothetical protein G01um101448_297 [Parcubacteria group bacterium Gr01-1014_48]TSD00863.1 MAG: hypothetical protein Greene101415_664 [Parcubacteria group bacterium Greene1014_15]TSD07945.1 MAG: hypothetical protein Greene07144_575 [Parcubacteria group bacterium Greene0714_4]
MKFTLIFENGLSPLEKEAPGLLTACLGWITDAYNDGWQGTWSLKFWIDCSSDIAFTHGVGVIRSGTRVNVRLGNRDIVDYFYTTRITSQHGLFVCPKNKPTIYYDIPAAWQWTLKPYVEESFAEAVAICQQRVNTATAEFEEIKAQFGKTDSIVKV